MVYRALADAVVLLHFGFLAYLIVGGFLAWRWRWSIVAHVAAAFWGFVVIAAALTCPLTYAEDWLRQRGGQGPLREGFIDHYIEGVLYPARYTALLQAAVALVVLVSWIGVAVRWRSRSRAMTAQ